MLEFFYDLGKFSLVALAMITFANFGFTLIRPAVVRLCTPHEFAIGLRNADIMLIIVPTLLLASSVAGYGLVEWVLQ